MIAASSWLALALVAAGQGSDPARAGLSEGRYPWYSAKTDGLVPVDPAPALSDINVSATGGGPGYTVGGVLALGLMAVAFLVLIGAIAWAILNFDDAALPTPRRAPPIGAAIRSGVLPSGLDVDADDLWAEAERRRGLGDLSGAIRCVFAHQLLQQEGRGRLRLAAGRTPRQLVRTVSDPAAREAMAGTLRLFEAALYGHREPRPAPFEAAWRDAVALNRPDPGGAPS